MRHYEQIFILKPTLTQEEINGRIESIKENITKNGGEILAFHDIGIRRLAYKVQKNPRGYYGVFYFKIQPSAIFELERLLRINEDVIKYLTIKYETKKELKAFQSMIDRANGKTSETSTNKDEVKEEETSQEENSEG